MRRISANYIFTNCTKPLKNGIIEIDNSGTILNVIDTKGELKETANLEFYNGIICPGFINAHCHLELSHLKNKISKKTHIPDFIQQVQKKRNEKSDYQIEYAIKADNEMYKNGIVAVGDISNSNLTFEIKKESKLKYHTFIELFGLEEGKAETIFQKNYLLYKKYSENISRNASLTPHSTYSLSVNLLKKISEFINKNKTIISVHHQETKTENDLFINGKGNLYNFIKNKFKTEFPASIKKLPIEYILNYIKNAKKILLIHNTYITKKDMEFLKAVLNKIVFVICPNSNLFIENSLPPMNLIMEYTKQIAIGTDSLASNDQLSVLEEMITLSKKFPEITLETLIKWGTINGAKALGFDYELGSLEKTKKPGINLVYNIDLQNLKLNEDSKIKVIA